MPRSGTLTMTTSSQWVDYFQTNAQNQREIHWELGAGASPAELAQIAPSLRGWQLGETSEGKHLLAAARNYAANVGDPGFVDAVGLFIAEEQRHGEMLGRYLDLARIARAQRDWGDTLFRAARYCLPSMEVWVTPVVMVETHAMVYYNAIRRATKSAVLRTICEQILADEVPHIRFQCERLAILHRRRSRWAYALTMATHRILFASITLAIWCGHRRALRGGGYTFRRFWRTAWAKMNHAWRTMTPAAYCWAENRDVSAESPLAIANRLPRGCTDG